MKRRLLVPTVIILALLVPTPLPGAPAASARSPDGLLPPVSITLVAIPPRLPPGGSGVFIVQLVDAHGSPSPARSDIAVGLFSSDPSIASVPQQVTVPFGKSHAEVEVKAGMAGSATLTAAANGLLSGSTKVSTGVLSNFALQLVPLNNPVSPGDLVHLRVGLLAAKEPFETPVGVQVSITTSLRGIPLQTVTIQPGSSDAYIAVSLPSGISIQTIPFMTVTAAASGFTAATAMVALSPQGANPQEALVGPPRANLTARSNEFLSVSLFNDTFAPSAGSVTLDLYSSNASVVEIPEAQVSTSGADSATFEVYANATGTAQITAVAPGLTSIPLTATVLPPLKPALGISLPPKVRAGETYSFAAGFYYGTEPLPYGPAPVSLSSSNLNVTVSSTVEATALGYGFGTLKASGTGAANITAVLEGATPATAKLISSYSPAVAPVVYQVAAASESGPLAGVTVNFTYGGRTSVTTTGPSGAAGFSTYNDTLTVASVPASISLSNRTYYFTGWSDGVKSTNISLLSSSSVYSITAQYFKSVVPTTYSLLAMSDGQAPVVGLRFTVSSRVLRANLTLTTDARGKVNFVLPNASSFSISVPELYQPSGQTRYSLLSLGNSTKNVVAVTAAATTIEATYATYYQFEVGSPIGNTTGSGWYRSGSTATYSVDETSSGGPLVYQRFSGWSGSFSSGQPSGSTVITSPEFITAQWSADNALLFAAIGVALAGAAVAGLLVFRLRRKPSPS
ncbi:MAG: hypothetical protein KGI38_05895 [Thaumarchaeota archaeon]|nr:hypothetical protein [Nitrososphaerota archaeon]